MAITTTSVLSAPVQQSFSYKLLSVPVPNMIYSIAATPKEMPAHGGTTIRFRRYNPLATAMVPLGNSGITPPAQVLTAIDIDAKMAFYGTYVVLNEQVTLQAQNPVLNEATLRLGVSLRQTEDQLLRDNLAATASFINCTGGINGDNPTQLSRSDVDEVVRTLLNNDTKSLMDSIDGEDKFGTGPIRNAFLALSSTQLSSNIENISGFLHTAQYPSPNKALRSEWGSVGNLRFLLSSIGSFTPNASNLGQNVYNTFCVGLESYASIKQNGYSSQFIYLDPKFSGPLALNASAGYKMAHASRILNDLWLLNLRSTRN